MPRPEPLRKEVTDNDHAVSLSVRLCREERNANATGRPGYRLFLRGGELEKAKGSSSPFGAVAWKNKDCGFDGYYLLAQDVVDLLAPRMQLEPGHGPLKIDVSLTVARDEQTEGGAM